MFRPMLKSKRHRATVPQADIDYVGSGYDPAEALPTGGLRGNYVYGGTP